jgi:sortase family protein
VTTTRAIAVTVIGAVFFLSGGGTHERARPVAPLVNARVMPTTTHDPWAVTRYLPAYRATPVVLRVADPTRVRIPAIGVDAALVRLGLRPDGTMDVPTDFGTTGWYTGGPRPGENGPAVIAGHVDSDTSPAVFYRLQHLRPGDEVDVPRADGTRSTFVVTRVARFDKEAFPTEDVFGPTADPELRLVTCGGDFDFTRLRYRANTVAFASLQSKQ